MNKTLLPWSLKGVSLDARSRAKAAAGSAGVPLGKWLSETIREIAGAESAKPAPAVIAAGPAGPASNDPMMVDPDTLSPERAAPALAATESRPVAAPMTGSEPDTAAVSDVSAGIGRGEEAEPAPSAAAPAPAPPADWQTAVADLSRRLDETEGRVAAAVAPLQSAVEQVLARLDRIAPARHRGWRLPNIRLFGRGR